MYHSFSLIEGEPIGIIRGGKMDGIEIKVKANDKKENQEFNITDEAEIIPYHSRQKGDEANRLVVSGPSLCGKTYFTRQFAEDYYEKYKDKGHKVILFTGIPRHNDKVFACDQCRDMDQELEGKSSKVKKANRSNYDCFCSKVYRIRCDESLLEDPIDQKELHNSLCIFDDTDRITNKDVGRALNDLRDILMCSGRHENIDLVSISQILMDGKKTKTALTNAFATVLFPVSGGRYQSVNYLKKYMSLEKDAIDKIINLPTRWALINGAAPMYCLHQKGCFMLS